MKLDPWNDEDFVGKSGQGQVVNDKNQSQYLNIKISYKKPESYIQVNGHSISQ